MEECHDHWTSRGKGRASLAMVFELSCEQRVGDPSPTHLASLYLPPSTQHNQIIHIAIAPKYNGTQIKISNVKSAQTHNTVQSTTIRLKAPQINIVLFIQ